MISNQYVDGLELRIVELERNYRALLETHLDGQQRDRQRIAELEKQNLRLINSLKDSGGSYYEMQQWYGLIFAENCEYQGRIAELETQLAQWEATQ